MEWLRVTLSMYRRVLLRAGELSLRNWPVAATAFVYAAIMWFGAQVAMSLGIAGGLVLNLVSAACVSSFLYLMEMIVRTSKASFEEFQRSFGVYLWDVVRVWFIVWIFFMLVTPALLQLPQGMVLLRCIHLAGFIFFNAVPELIYLGRDSSLGLLVESYRFVSANWLEWLPVAVLSALIYVLMPNALDYSAGLMLFLIPLFYVVMVVRGLLFLELHNSTYRGRLFKFRAGG